MTSPADPAAPVAAETIELPFVTLVFEGPLATLTLDDPDRLNAMGPDMAGAIITAINEVAKPRRRCRALLITGRGRAFCAGVNLMGNRQAVAEGTARLPAVSPLEGLFHPMLRRLHRLPIPVIAGVNGLAVGIGLGLVMAADYVVAADAAWFQAPFRNLASAPDSGLTCLLRDTIGPLRAKRMLMRAERVPAQDALAWGMVSEVVPAADLAARAREVAGEFAGGPTIALAEIKQLLDCNRRTALQAAFEAEAAAVAVTSRTKDNVAAIRVFGKKDAKPVFTGE